MASSGVSRWVILRGMSASTSVAEDLRELTERLDAAAADLVPWFHAELPAAYFENTDRKTRLEHMAAILALRATGQEPRLRIKSGDGRRVTFVLPEDAPGMLEGLMRELGDAHVRAAKIYSSRDARLCVDSFELGESPPCDLGDPLVQSKLAATLELASRRGDTIDEASLNVHFKRLTLDYATGCSPFRILAHAALWRDVDASGGAAVALEDQEPGGRARIIVAAANVAARRMLSRVAQRLGTLGMNIVRAYVDTIAEGEERSVVIVSTVVELEGKARLDPEGPLWRGLRRDLLRLNWLEDDTLALAYRAPSLGLDGAATLHAYCDLVHLLLLKSDRYVFSRAHVREIVEGRLDLASNLVRLFERRFDPERLIGEEAWLVEARAARAELKAATDDDVARRVWLTLLEAIAATEKTNHFVERRYALALSLSPALLTPVAPRPEVPFAVFFVHGRSFLAFHVRFRDTARGGVRVVCPAGAEQHVRETERLYDEVYELAFAQQLKNKDIPEGGAKAVILVEPGRVVTRCVRAFADAILDLITTESTTRSRVVDRRSPPRPEWIYFGPDENITPEHIVWIVERAKTRGYPFPNALMSSKPGAGINHKEYGVTSEGLNVFLEVGLGAIGIDPRRDGFSIKLTGGPDGDVGGNELKILMREYGERVRVVGVADGSGCAEDPDGLDHGELSRLVARSAPIGAFDRARLGARGRVSTMQDADGARLRNEMHNRVTADAFVPAGGRPGTMNGDNWRRFLGADGKPSSRLIVEGANLFLTNDARQGLSSAGVIIIKDSSANKCGVICSSYEITASLMLEEAEFLAIKPLFVAQVLGRLRHLARLEAEALIDAHRRWPGTPLPELSVSISREIHRLKNALGDAFAALERDHADLVRAAVLDHLPAVLVEAAGERLWTRLPSAYRAQIACASVGARLVYREGIDYFRDVAEDQLAALAIAYLERERRTGELVAAVERAGLAEGPEIAALLRLGGTRAGLKLR